MNTPKRILVVDDDSFQRGFIERLLKGEGYDVKTAVDVADALPKLASKPPDATVSDNDMPNKQGIDFLRELRAGIYGDALKNIPFILASANMDPTLEAEAMRAGASGCVVKGTHLADLLVILERIFSSP